MHERRQWIELQSRRPRRGSGPWSRQGARRRRTAQEATYAVGRRDEAAVSMIAGSGSASRSSASSSVASRSHAPYDRPVPAILYPDPPLTGKTFVLRRLRARDFDAAVAARADREAARWVNPIPFPAGGTMARFLEAQRRRGMLLHFAIVDQVDAGYL